MNGWLSSVRRMSLVRLLVFFAVLLAAYIAAQLGRIWLIRHAPARSADWISIGATFVAAALLLGIYTALVRWMEARAARELAPDPIRALAGIILGLALFSSVFGFFLRTPSLTRAARRGPRSPATRVSSSSS